MQKIIVNFPVINNSKELIKYNIRNTIQIGMYQNFKFGQILFKRENKFEFSIYVNVKLKQF